MKPKQKIVASLMVLSIAGLAALPATAEDSVGRASAASLGASLVGVSVAGWAAYEGSEFTVKAIQASADGVVLVLQGASGAVETSAKVAGDAIQAASVGVGTSVEVVAQSTGHALLASGVLLAFVPNEIGRALLHHSRY
jgi:ribosomal protein L7/L12